jgi:cytochrome c oxidase subunit 2
MTTFLIYAVIVLGIVAIGQLVKVFELTKDLNGKKEEEVSFSENRMNGTLFFVFYLVLMACYVALIVKYQDIRLPVAASEHGVELDWLMDFNLIIVNIVFVAVNFVLFFFAFKYYGRGQKATFYTHSNKLELIWTMVPSAVLAVVIIYGLKTWNEITGPASEDAIVIELYSKQFDWTARYAGTDNLLGDANVRRINGANFLGIDSSDVNGHDDIVVKGEFHMPVGKEIALKFRSQDVLHGAYMPHFRAQMNTVPGMITQFHLKPTITTAEMKIETGNENFEYILLCNKICGASHYNMQMTIIVETEAEYKQWMSEQKEFLGKEQASNVLELDEKLIAENK